MRLLILPSALAELRGVESRSERRRLVAHLAQLAAAPAADRLAGGGRHRRRAAGHRILYARRAAGDVVIVALRPDAID